jgi:two-component SAPR family response regulator
MKHRFKVYLIEPCPVIAAHLSACIVEMGGAVYHSKSCFLPEKELSNDALNPLRAIESDLAIVAVAPQHINKLLFLAAQLHWQFELPVIWSSTLPIGTVGSHYMLEHYFPILHKPFSENQVKRVIRDTLSLM